MKILSLDRLVGPGTSVSENFEILMLELVKSADNLGDGEAYRISAPDHGIDLFYSISGYRVAMQCKAYPIYRSDLVRAVSQSISTANINYDQYRWDLYGLAIPFVPTAKQRQELEKVLKTVKTEYFIYDGDQIESSLYSRPHIVDRFFPTIRFVVPPQSRPICLETGLDKKTINIQLVSSKTGQLFNITVSHDAKCGGLVNLLVMALKLPDVAKVTASGYVTLLADIKWNLYKESTEGEPLNPDKTIEESGLRDSDTVCLGYELFVKSSGGFMKAPGSTLEYKARIGSTLWEDKEMGKTRYDGQETQALNEYLESKLSKLRI